jgi:hypothetical protein
VPVVEGRRILGQIASALAAAHARGIIHRDIKPANVLVDEDSGRVLVTDFGIAAVRPGADVEAPAHLTGTGMAIGTPQYMSPEQLLAEKVTEKTDIYSLGLLAYHILTGEGPFQISSPREIMAAHLRDEPRRLAELVPEVDPDLEAAVASCLAKRAADRPDAATLATRLGTTDAVLEWPPPELEGLLGAARRAGRGLSGGAWLVTLPAVAAIVLGPRAGGALGGLGVMALGVVALVGFLVLVVESVRLVRLMREAARAVRAGYGWLTVAEVAADARGDTGSLVAGAREYALLPPRRRGHLRYGRLVGAALRLLGVVAPIPMLLLAMLLGAADAVSPAMAIAVAYLPTLLLALAAATLERWEALAVRGYRRRQAPPGTDQLPRLVAAWYESFEAVRQDQAPARGAATRPALGRWGAAVVALVLLGGAAVLIPVLIVGVLGPLSWLAAVPKFSNTEAKVRLANTVRSYRLPFDTTIRPLQAGEAFVSLQVRGSGPFPTRGLDAAVEWFPPGSPMEANFLYRSDSLLARGARGAFTPEERAYLARVAANPAFAHLAVLGRAPRLDDIGARFLLPFPDSVTWFEMPIPKFASTKEAAYANLARAALAAAEGRSEEAETLIRETIGFGLLLSDESSTLIQTLVGNVVTGTGRAGLLGFYEGAGRTAEAQALRAAYDSVVRVNDALDSAAAAQPVSRDASALRQSMLAILTDPNRSRGLRWEMVHILSYAPCTNLRELIFGRGRDIRAAVAAVRPQLARTPGEEELFNLVQRSAEHFPRRLLPDRTLAHAAYTATAAAGALLGNPRIVGCLGPIIANTFSPD